MQLQAFIAAMLGLSFLVSVTAPAASQQATGAAALRLAQAQPKADDDDDGKGKSRRPERGDAKAREKDKAPPTKDDAKGAARSAPDKAKDDAKGAAKSAPDKAKDAAAPTKAPAARQETKQETKQEPKSDTAPQRDRAGPADKAKQDADKAARETKSREDDARSRSTQDRTKQPPAQQQTQERPQQPAPATQTQERAKQPATQQTKERRDDDRRDARDRGRDDDRRDSSRERDRDDDRRDARDRGRDDDRRDSSRERDRDDDRRDARDRGRDDDRRDRDDDRRDVSRDRDRGDRERFRDWAREREERRTSVDELRRTEIRGDRTITIDGGTRTLRRDGDRIVIRGYDFDRLRHGRNGRGDTRVERLPNGHTRTVVFYPDGTQIVTVTGTRGEIVHRYRRDRGGREIVLIREVRRPPVAQLNLGPLRVTIPREQYIVDARHASRQDIRAALIAPPVEPVERVYTLEEVRQFDRIRDKMRRIDVTSITFETDSALIEPSQAQALEELASVIADMIQRNPSEVFLIEGHTDLVGDDVYNLALSDRRAEAVAVALTDYFNVPPENLVTQGYGEQYPKIPTDISERENRRVAVRRITPLVAEN
ncbi:MAG TPA: OmpA family protein [Xanthobacteraceae bacterium]|nr:OmpA family protein [Xanthobacteraceae bacterium]